MLKDDFEQLWVVYDEDDANQLLNVGWKFIQILYVEKKLHDAGFWRTKTVGTKRNTRYLMGRPNGVLPRENDEYLVEYLKRVKGENQSA